jgi:hypothetical protein
MKRLLHRLNKFLDRTSEYLVHRKGLLPMIGLLLVALNLVFQFVLVGTWLASSNLFLHLGVILAIVGLLLAWAL